MIELLSSNLSNVKNKHILKDLGFLFCFVFFCFHSGQKIPVSDIYFDVKAVHPVLAVSYMQAVKNTGPI